MPEEKLHRIEELPDLKANWTESYKCLNEPLLEYVWEVANHFLPGYEETDKGMIPTESMGHRTKRILRIERKEYQTY